MKKRVKIYGSKTLAVLLSVLLLFYIIPSTVYAEWFKGSDEQTASTGENIRTKEAFELTERREESIKHFRLEDGSVTAVQYAGAVHRADESGKWQDIDNRLSAKEGTFVTSDNRLKFAQKTTESESLFTLHEQGREIAISLNGAKNNVAGKVTATETRFGKDATQLQKLMTLDNLSTNILYADILNGVDLEYVAVSNDVKENIIVKERKDTYVYAFTIRLNNLEAVLTESGSVVILDSKTREPVYIIPAPVVYDSNEVFASAADAFYTLTEMGNNTYSLTISVNPEWMNNETRVFPVIVDPTVSVAKTSVTDTYIDGAYPDEARNLYNFIAVGHGSLSEEFISYLRFDISSIPANAHISSATLKLDQINWYNYSNSETLYIGAYQVLTPWTSAITWMQFATGISGDFSPGPVSYSAVNSQLQPAMWDITSLFRKWVDGSAQNYGVALCAMEEDIDCFATFASSRHTYSSPLLEISYRDMKGVEPYWSYSSQSAGLAGTGYINRATGTLTFTKGLLSTTDSLFPYTPTLVYSSALASQQWAYPNVQSCFQNSYMPLGFQWNMRETVIKKSYITAAGTGDVFYIWADADGTEHYFTRDVEGQPNFSDEDGLQLKICEGIDYITIEDDSKIKKTFSSLSVVPSGVIAGWYLTSITDKNGNMISFDFNSAFQPTTVCLTPKGSSKITFLKILYLSSNLPYLIWNEVSKEAIVFRYSSTYNGSLSTSNEQYLRELIYAHGNSQTTAANWLNYYSGNNPTNITVDGKVSYTYDENGHLIKAKDELSNYQISYTYTNGRITVVYENGQGGDLGQEIRFGYYNGYTEVRTSGTDDVIGNADDLITRYTFDREGRTAGVYSTDVSGTQIYGGSASIYETYDKIKNNVKESVTVGGSATNYLLNGGFESIQSAYIADHWISSSNNVRFAGSYAESNESCGVIFNVQANTTDFITQYTRLPAGTYTLSLGINSFNCQNVKAYMIAESLNRNYTFTEEIPINEYDAGNFGFFVSTSFAAESYYTDNSEDFKITIKVVGGSSINNDMTLSMGSVMLEKSIGNNRYSLIQYGNFEPFAIDAYGNSTNNFSAIWQRESGTFSSPFNSASPFGMSGKIVAGLTENKYLKQTFYHASPDDIAAYDLDDVYDNTPKTFNVSGFAKGTGQVTAANSAFRLRIDVKYYMGSGNNNEVESFCFDFQNDCRDWQFVCGTFTTKENRLIHSIDLYCEYNHQPTGYALFDDIAVCRNTDDSNVKYHYYTDDPAMQNHPLYHVEYNPALAGLVHARENRNYMEVYEYNNDRRLVRKVNNRGELYEYTYANNGVDISYEVYYHFTRYGSSTNTLYPYLADNPDALITKTPKTKTTYTYNTYGQVTSTLTFEVIYSGDNIVAKIGAQYVPSSYSYQTTAGSRIFGALLSTTNALGETARYFYDGANGRLLASINEETEYGTSYSYDAIGNLIYVCPAIFDSVFIDYVPMSGNEKVSYTYNAQNRLDEIATNSTVYSFSYDSFGNADSVSAGNNQLAEYEYNDYNGKLKQINYGNGYAERYVYDELDNVKEVWYTGNSQAAQPSWNQAYEYSYTAYGQLSRFDNLRTGKSTIYKYDSSGKMTRFIEFDTSDRINEFSADIHYNDQNNVDRLTYISDYHYSNSSSVKDASLYYRYFYNPDGSLWISYLTTDVTNGQTNYSYDTFARLSEKTIDFYVIGNSNTRFTNSVTYDYENNGSNTSARVSSYISAVHNSATAYQYVYDGNGNISQIKDFTNTVQYQYTYDILGQLIREDNRPLNKSYVYTYDKAGNRTSKKTYAFSLGALGSLQEIQEYSYTASNSGWGDRMNGVGVDSVLHDSIGNTTFIGFWEYEDLWEGVSLQWEGRRLLSYTLASNFGGGPDIYSQSSYTYNDQGIRTSKTVNGVLHTYYLDGSRVVMEIVSQNNAEQYRLLYLYDESGSPLGMLYRTPAMAAGAFYTFWFEKNLQGDIIAVYNESGTKVVSYIYDAWGNVTQTVILNSGTNQFATLNPFRYRGYYYDAETGYYYLNSRYYNPDWGRFLNADGYVSTGSGLLGYNMFAYCNNNPVMFVDPEGDFPWLVVIVIVCAVTSIIAEYNMPSQEEHYARNSNDTVSPPQTIDQVPDDWKTSNGNDSTRAKGAAANAHQFTSPKEKSNIKLTSPNGETEGIYNKDGWLVTDPRDMGSHNFCPSGEWWEVGKNIGHYVKDIKPWIRWGNSPDDTTTSWQRMRALIGWYD